MKKNVCITIKSTQTVDEEKDTTELFTFGAMEQFDGGFRLHYDESEATGFEGSSVTLEVSDNMVTMTRSGKVISSLFIEKGKKHHCHYGTEYGDMLLGISASRIINRLSEEGGVLYFKYTIDINSAFVSENEIYFEVSFD